MNGRNDIGAQGPTSSTLKFETVDLDPVLEALEDKDLGLETDDLPGAVVPLKENSKDDPKPSDAAPNDQELFLLNPTGGAFRPPDKQGQGHFGAPRAHGPHEGQDIVGQPGQDIRAPLSGVVTKIGYSYSDDLSFRYIQIKGEEDVSARVHYVDPSHDIEVGSKVERGDVIGTLLSLRGRYPNITDHVHLELKVANQLVDPAPYVLNSADNKLLVGTKPEVDPTPPTP